MKRLNPFCSFVLYLLVAGCSTSVEVKDFKPAQHPQGIHMEVKLNGDVVDGNKLEGELLAVRQDGVLLNVSDYPGRRKGTRLIVLVPFWMMDTVTLEQMGRAKVESQGEEQNQIYLDRLRRLARFPQGLSEELLAQLLEKYGQEQLEEPRRAE